MSDEERIELLEKATAGMQRDSDDEALTDEHRRLLRSVAAALKVEAYRLKHWPAYLVQEHFLNIAADYLDPLSSEVSE